MPFLNVSVRSSVAIIVNTVFCKRMNESILMGNNDKCDPSGKGMKQEVEGQGHARLKTELAPRLPSRIIILDRTFHAHWFICSPFYVNFLFGSVC